jgi:hypothetical protein
LELVNISLTSPSIYSNTWTNWFYTMCLWTVRSIIIHETTKCVGPVMQRRRNWWSITKQTFDVDRYLRDKSSISSSTVVGCSSIHIRHPYRYNWPLHESMTMPKMKSSLRFMPWSPWNCNWDPLKHCKMLKLLSHTLGSGSNLD